MDERTYRTGFCTSFGISGNVHKQRTLVRTLLRAVLSPFVVPYGYRQTALPLCARASGFDALLQHEFSHREVHGLLRLGKFAAPDASAANLAAHLPRTP